MASRPVPLVGLSTSELRAAASEFPEGDPPMRNLLLGLAYPKAVEDAGAVAVVIAPTGADRVDALLDRLDALVLTGGPDLHPAAYRQHPHAALGPTEPELDDFELALVRGAADRDLPVLGICRGAQLINVAFGGTLLQDVPDLVGKAVGHRQSERGEVATHPVTVAADSRLASLLGACELRVNSFHHQAADRLGAGLRAVAWAPDGVVEGIEAPDRRFMLGVQWHAESISAGEADRGLFAALVAAAGERRVGAAPASA